MRKDILKDLQMMAGEQYCKFYRLIEKVMVIKAYVEYRHTISYSNFDTKLFVVEHSTGKFSFPIENIKSNAWDERIENIFRSLCNMPLITKEQIAA